MPDHETQLALDGSMSALRMAAKILNDAGMPIVARHMELQADRIQALLLKSTTFARHDTT